MFHPKSFISSVAILFALSVSSHCYSSDEETLYRPESKLSPSELKELLEPNPEEDQRFYEHHFGLAGQYLEDGDDDHAEMCFKVAAESENPKHLFALGLFFDMQERYGEAKAQYLKAVEKHHPEASGYLALAIDNLDDKPSTAEALKYARIAAKAGFPDAAYELGLRYTERRHYHNAFSFFDLIIGEHALRAKAMLRAAKICERMLNEPVPIYVRACSTEEGAPPRVFYQAVLEWSTGEKWSFGVGYRSTIPGTLKDYHKNCHVDSKTGKRFLHVKNPSVLEGPGSLFLKALRVVRLTLWGEKLIHYGEFAEWLSKKCQSHIHGPILLELEDIPSNTTSLTERTDKAAIGIRSLFHGLEHGCPDCAFALASDHTKHERYSDAQPYYEKAAELGGDVPGALEKLDFSTLVRLKLPTLLPAIASIYLSQRKSGLVRECNELLQKFIIWFDTL